MSIATNECNRITNGWEMDMFSSFLWTHSLFKHTAPLPSESTQASGMSLEGLIFTVLGLEPRTLSGGASALPLRHIPYLGLQFFYYLLHKSKM